MAGTVAYGSSFASLGEDGLLTVEAGEYLHGCLAVSRERDGWVRPWRLSSEQVRAVGSCQAWHPGLYRQMARATAGVTLEFETDASEVVLEVLVDLEPNGTKAVLDAIDGQDGRLPHDGVSADVDGRHLPCHMPAEGGTSVVLTLDDTSVPDAHGMLHLPGFGVRHHVRVWLPALRGCAVRSLVANGTYVDVVPARKALLVFGDSIAQGFVTDDPSLSWPAQLADKMGLDLLNQGLGGQVFQPGSLFGVAHAVDVAAIVVAFGENYRFEPCLSRAVVRDVRGYLNEVARIWGDVPTYVLTPTWHDEELSPSHPMSCWVRVPSIITANVAVHDHMVLVDGMALHDHDESTLADVDGHPNAKGATQMAQRLHALTLVGRGGAEERRERALKILDGAPNWAFPLAEGARRHIGEFIVVEEGCVVWDVGDGLRYLYAPDHDLAASVIEVIGGEDMLCVCDPSQEFMRRMGEMCGFSLRVPHHLAIYGGDKPLAVDPDKDIRVLDAGFIDEILATYSHADLLMPGELEEALEKGHILGGFEDDALVGYVGEHTEGSIGMIEVLEGYRRQGWAHALEAAQINRTLGGGHIPWCEVFPQNRASIALQRSLGMTVTPADEQWYLSLPLGGTGA